MGFTAPKAGQPFGGFAGNKSLKPQAHKLGFFLNARQLSRALDKLIINGESRSHMYHMYHR